MVVGIIGLGLMGGSLGLALQQTKLVTKVVGFDHNVSHCEEALKLSLVHDIVSFSEIKQSDVIFLAIPVGGIIAVLQLLQDISPNTTIIDLGSTKAEIVASVPTSIRTNFIAAHPMTGTEKFGPSAALQNLYHDKNQYFFHLIKTHNNGAYPMVYWTLLPVSVLAAALYQNPSRNSPD